MEAQIQQKLLTSIGMGLLEAQNKQKLLTAIGTGEFGGSEYSKNADVNKDWGILEAQNKAKIADINRDWAVWRFRR